jgi:hypothetical protein
MLMFGEAIAEPSIDFESSIWPLIQEHCLTCHQDKKIDGKLKKAKAGFRMDSATGLMAGGVSGPSIIPGEAGQSYLMDLITLKQGDEDLMPPKKGPMPKVAIETFRKWIGAGAPFGQWRGQLTDQESPETRVHHLQNIVQKRQFNLPMLTTAQCQQISNGLMVEAITLENKLFSLSCNSKTMKNLTSWESLTQHIFRLDLDDVELDLFPFEAMDHVHEIRITNSELSHDALLSIGELKSLRRLNLYGSQLSSSWLLDMVSWTHLEQLILTDSGCDDDMLTILKSELKDTQLIY